MSTIMPTSLLKARARYAATAISNRADRRQRGRRKFASFNLLRVVMLGEGWND